MESSKIIHVHLKDATRDKTDYYFGSIKAIYSVLGHEDIGRTYESLTASCIAKNGGFENKKCIIRVDRIIRNGRQMASK